MKKTGTAFKFGDNISTDLIISGRYKFAIRSMQELAKYVMEDADPHFYRKVQNKPSFIVAGWNFGMGSSREQAAAAVKYAGIRVIIAKSFARIYFRNAINAGMPAIKSPEAVEAVENGDEVTVDMQKGEIITPRGTFTFPPYPRTVMDILDNNGLINYIKSKIKNKQ